MAVKGKHKARLQKYKSRSRRHRTRSRRHANTTRRRVCRLMRGGNYALDVTTRELEGVPTKPLNKMVVTVPGFGTMSGAAYKRLMEDLDRNGNDEYT
jgi:hypothetical protein